MKVAQSQLQNYLVNRSFLHKKAANILQVLNFYRCIQVDPISVVAKTHEISLWNRVEGFKLGDLEKELYENKSLFEYWMQLFSIIPIQFYPNFSARFNKKAPWHEKFYSDNEIQIKAVLEFIKKN